MMRFATLSMLVAACVLVTEAPNVAFAQPPAAPNAAPKPAPRPTANRRKETPPPEAVSMTTKDGVTIHGTYYGSPEGKTAIPVILLPGWERSQRDVAGLAAAMQKQGLAVMTVDMRGHGKSESVQGPRGQVIEIDLDRIRPADFQRYVTQDLEAVKAYLMEENNKGNLNIEMLTIVGCDYSALVALNFAAQDWSWPILPALKQGQDVKGLILVSPPKTFRGFNANNALRMPAVQGQISIMIIAGEGDRTDLVEAKKIFNQIDKVRNKNFAEESDRTVFLAVKPTDLSGTALLADPRANCLKDILFFTKTHLAELQANDPWRDRTPPGN